MSTIAKDGKPIDVDAIVRREIVGVASKSEDAARMRKTKLRGTITGFSE